MSKSTNAEARAEARRRSRIAAKERAERGDEPLEAATAPAAQTATGQSAQSSLGFRAAFRGSFGVAPIRDDLRQLPRLLRTRAFFVPLAAIAVTTIAATQQ